MLILCDINFQLCLYNRNIYQVQQCTMTVSLSHFLYFICNDNWEYGLELFFFELCMSLWVSFKRIRKKRICPIISPHPKKEDHMLINTYTMVIYNPKSYRWSASSRTHMKCYQTINHNILCATTFGHDSITSTETTSGIQTFSNVENPLNIKRKYIYNINHLNVEKECGCIVACEHFEISFWKKILIKCTYILCAHTKKKVEKK